MLRASALIAVLGATAAADPREPSPLPALPILPSAPSAAIARPAIFEMLAGVATSLHGTQGGALGLRGLWRPWSAELMIDVALPETDNGVDVWRGGATLAVCRHLGPIALCPLASAGWIRGSGEMVETTTSPLVSIGARIEAELQITHRLAVRSRIDGRVLLTSTALTSRAEGWLGIDVVVRISR